MGRFRKHNVDILHKNIGSSAIRWQSRDSFGTYGLVHGMYHLAIVGIEEDIWMISTDKRRSYQQFIQTKNMNVILQNHQWSTSYFVKKSGAKRQHDPRLCHLLLHGQTLRDQSQEWVQQALEDYRQGSITAETIFEILSFMPKQKFFACIAILLAMDIRQQQETQTGRLNNVRQILERLQEEVDSCEKHTPLYLVGWFSEQISILWNIPMQDLLSVEQIGQYLQEHPEKIPLWYERMSIQKADFLTRFIFPNPSFKEFISDWLEESSVEELKQIEMTYITSPENKKNAIKNPRRRHSPLASPRKNWDYITILGFHLTKKSGALSEKSWSIWHEHLNAEGKFVRRRGLRRFQWLRPDMLDWIVKHHPENEFRVVFEKEAKLYREKRKSHKRLQDKMDELRDFDFQNMDKEQSRRLSSVFKSLDAQDISIEEQDQIYHLIFPELKKQEEPIAEVFCYLYIHQENHSPSVGQELESYFKRYFSRDWVWTHELFFMAHVVRVLNLLLTRLHQHHRLNECQKLHTYIVSLQEKDDLIWLSKSIDYETIPLHWGDVASVFAHISKTPSFVRDRDSFTSDIDRRLDSMVEKACRVANSPTLLATVLQHRFFFQHPFLNTINRLGRLSSMLVQISDSQLLSSRIVVALLDSLLMIPVQSRFTILRGIQKTIRSLQLSKWPVQKQTQLQSRMHRLYAEANTQKEDLFVTVSIKSLNQLAETLQLADKTQETESRIHETYKKNHQKWIQDALAKVAQGPTDDWMESIDDTMESMRTLLMNTQLLDHQIADVLRVGFSVLQDWEQKIEELEDDTFPISKPLLIHYPKTWLYIISTWGHIANELMEEFHPQSETQQIIANVLYEHSQSKYDAQSHLLTMMVLLNQDFSKGDIHHKLFSLLVHDMEVWAWTYDDGQATIQLLGQYNLWIKMHLFLQKHQQSLSHDSCEQQWLSYLNRLPCEYLMELCIISKNSNLLPTIEPSNTQKQNIRDWFLQSEIMAYQSSDLHTNGHLFILHCFPEDQDVMSRLLQSVLALESVNIKRKFVSHLSEAQYDILFHVLRESEHLQNDMGSIVLFCLNRTAKPTELLRKFISTLYDNVYLETIEESIQWLYRQDLWTNEQLFECHLLFLNKSEKSAKYLQKIIESSDLTSNDIWRTLQKIHHRETFLSLVLRGIESGWLDKKMILLELQKKVLILQLNCWENAGITLLSPWEGLGDVIKNDLIILQTMVELLFTGWDYVLDPFVCMCDGLKQGWYTMDDITSRLQKKIQTMNLNELRKTALTTMNDVNWEMDIVLEVVKNYSQQDDDVMVQDILDTCPSLLEL